MIKDMTCPTRKTLLLRRRFLVMKAVLLIHLVSLFHGADSVTYLETPPLEIVLANQSSKKDDFYLGADLAIDKHFTTFCHTDHEPAPWIRVQFQKQIVARAVIYNILANATFER